MQPAIFVLLTIYNIRMVFCFRNALQLIFERGDAEEALQSFRTCELSSALSLYDVNNGQMGNNFNNLYLFHSSNPYYN